MLRSIMFLLILVFAVMAKVVIVDPNGQIKTIQAGINVAAPGDTVKVLPGTYEEQVVLNKDIILMGSGYENTIITGNFAPTVKVKSGVMQWFTISSLSGEGVEMGGGKIRNVVVRSCAQTGVYGGGGESYIENCVIYQNGGYGVYSNNGTLNVVNTISWDNRYRGYYTNSGGAIKLNYSIGSYDSWGGGIYGKVGVKNEDPQFTSEDDFHIGSNSPAWDAGHPSMTDPDGSRADMGYFGGPHAPIYPVVTKIQIIPLENGGVRIEATGRANW